MRIKRKNGLKMIVIALVLLLFLALAVGITGAYYQAKRQATGTLNMDQGIVIDYKGFGKTPDEGIWTRENKTTFLLFSETNAQPGEHIAVNAAGIRANEKSVNFYARVKLSYKFYNGETPVELADATKLIKTSSSFFGTNWVDGGSSDGYYYYATGSTLNKFTKTSTTFVELFATDAKFVIEGAGFTGADNNGEGGGFKIDETTSINKIEVYLTLETLQGDATAEQAKALGWKIASQVKFAEATGKMETSVKKESTTEDLNVSVAGATEVPIKKVVFPYDADTTLKFGSNNVEYISLTYSDGSTETFDAEAYEVAENTFKVNAKSSKGTVTGYTVGLFKDSEYTGLTFSNSLLSKDGSSLDLGEDFCVTGYLGEIQNGVIDISSQLKIRKRDFKLVIPFESLEDCTTKFQENAASVQYPCYINGEEIKSLQEMLVWYHNNIECATEETFNLQSPLEIVSQQYCVTTGWYSEKSVVAIGYGALVKSEITEVKLPNTIKYIGEHAFQGSGITTINLPSSLISIGTYAFDGCSLQSINISSVETIAKGAFGNCSKLTQIVLPNNLISFGEQVFMGCSKLENITINSNVLVSISDNSKADFFEGCTDLINIYVPADLVDAYKADANWRMYAGKIKAIA